MNDRVLRILEFNKIIDMLAGEAGSDLSRERVRALRPLQGTEAVREALRETTEAVQIIDAKGPLPTEGLTDIRPSVDLAYKGAVLSMKDLLEVRSNLEITDRVVVFMKGELPDVPKIRSRTDLLVPCDPLRNEIGRCILTEDEMADNASPELRRLRESIRRKNEEVRVRLERIVSRQENQTVLRDAIVTIRDGRYVIPVKAEHRQRVPGIVHDQSKGGATLFIEPQVIVDMNNELKELMLAEQAEVTRILKALSERVAENRYALKNNENLLLELDFIMAKGKLSAAMKGEEPILDESGALDLVRARHPLLDPKKAVPVSVPLGGAYKTLVITGPNTGGKTLTLKTMGLLSLMTASGLHIPASAESRIPVYDEIFADIGDEQSIEQSLSTFSAHMINIVDIVNKATENTLVLIDELGAGTDPTEGAALGIAILEELNRSGASVAATTHYNELKKYALTHDGVENASMEFDVETLSPTYRLTIGVAGHSNAFEISRKLGLPDRVIERAGDFVERGDAEFQNLLASVNEEKVRAERDREQAEILRRDAEETLERARSAEKKLEGQREAVVRRAREEARDILRDARETADEVRKELRRASRSTQGGADLAAVAESSRRLREKEQVYQETIVRRVNSNPVKASQLAEGDLVRVLSLEQNGELLSTPDERDEVLVRIGSMKMKIPLTDLMLLNDGSKRAQKKQTVKRPDVVRRKAVSVSPSVDVRGENADSAVMDVGKYLDDVSLSGLKEVTIIHGRGQGILRDAIRASLRQNRHVESFRPGAYNEGGEGVTIVTMK